MPVQFSTVPFGDEEAGPNQAKGWRFVMAKTTFKSPAIDSNGKQLINKCESLRKIQKEFTGSHFFWALLKALFYGTFFRKLILSHFIYLFFWHF